MTEKELYAEMDSTQTALLQAVSSFEQEQVDMVPFEDSWTAGQVAEHMILANSGFVELINGPARPTQRRHDQMAEGIKTAFLDFQTKMKSPEFVRPVRSVHQKEELLKKMEKIKEELLNAVSGADLVKTCTAFEIPSLGHLTRLEALYFVLYHTQRHVRQLKNIRRVMSLASEQASAGRMNDAPSGG